MTHLNIWTCQSKMSTLWDIVNTLNIEHIVTAMRQLSYGHAAFMNYKERLDVAAIEACCIALEKCETPLLDMGFKTSAGMINKFLDSAARNMMHGDWTGVQFSERCHAVFSVIQCETMGVLCFQLEPKNAPFLDVSGEFKILTNSRFPASVAEMEDSAKCLAFERNTACVFHSMRAIEICIKAVWKTLGQTPIRLPDSWGRLIAPMDDELAKTKDNRIPLWISEETFFSALVADFRAINKGWRNTSIHVDGTYDRDQALKIFNAVVGMLNHIASRMDETGTIFPS